MKLDFIYTISCFTWKESYCLPEVSTVTAFLLTLLHLRLELDFFLYLVTTIKERADYFVICLYNGSNKY